MSRAGAPPRERDTPLSASELRPTEHVEFVLLVIPDVNGSLRGKALRPDAFEAALRHGTVMTDLLLALDPLDTPIAAQSAKWYADLLNTTTAQSSSSS